jgi:hydroxymethylpyrimidine pyrophosphatase-like HAD family hydrolase
MRYYALVCDFDGTLAWDGIVNEQTIAALERVRNSGRRLILVTGRELEDLLEIFPRLDLFERVVVENGALIYRPATHEKKFLCDRPSEEFVSLLHQRGVAPLSVGHCIVATREPHEITVLETIHDLGLELQVIFNKGAIMALPSGINKASGLQAALVELGLSPHNVVGIGDAENDHAFLSLGECSVAVANALPTIKEKADFVTKADHGAGVIELIDRLLASDLSELEPRLTRHEILLGKRQDEQEVHLKPYGVNFLIAGTSGSGKSTFATGFMERLAEQAYQYCIVDPEGDYQNFEGAVVLGDSKRVPTVNEIIQLLEQPQQNGVINLLGISLDHRPQFFNELFPALLELRARSGRPHWIIIDEAHHLLPTSWAPSSVTVPQELKGLAFITVHPEHVAQVILASIDLILAIGKEPAETIQAFVESLGEKMPPVPVVKLQPGEAIAWQRRSRIEPFWFRSIPPRAERQRHSRKYAEGEMTPESVFYFRGPAGKLNLRAQNLQIFVQIAEGVDDETWLYHLRRGDYSRWFRNKVKDEELAAATEKIEQMEDISSQESRALIEEKIEARYTAPA